MKKQSKQKSGVSDSELRILKQLWEAGPAGPGELQERLAAAGIDWAYTTVQTLLHRLHGKGVVSRERQGVVQVYRAEIDSNDLLLGEMGELAERVGSSAESSLVLNLVRGKRLTKKDIANLRRLLDEAEANKGKLPGS